MITGIEHPAPSRSSGVGLSRAGEEIVHSRRKLRGEVNPLVVGSNPTGPILPRRNAPLRKRDCLADVPVEECHHLVDRLVLEERPGVMINTVQDHGLYTPTHLLIRPLGSRTANPTGVDCARMVVRSLAPK